MALGFPIIFSISWLLYSFGINDLFDQLGTWKHVAGPLFYMLIIYPFFKLNLIEKRVRKSTGIFIIISAVIIGLIIQ